MTIPYNVSKTGIMDQLIQYFEWVKIDNTNLLKPKWHPEDSKIYITKKELYALADLIHNTLYDNHPKLKAFVEYLEDMAGVFQKLGLPLTWVTPSGLTVKQNYVAYKTIRVKANFNDNKYTIKVPTDKTQLSKQKAGFMPNLVHSMDAANIFLMIDFLIKQNKYINIFTVHDCFATSPYFIENINSIVRYAFLLIYSDNKYIDNLHKHCIENISSTYTINEDNTVTNSLDQRFRIPTPPKCEDLNLREILEKAIYFIH